MLDGVPLHPLLVHAPLVLGVLAPVVSLVLWGAIAGRYLHHRVWWLAVFIHLAAFGASIVAFETGQEEEEKVEEVIEHRIIHQHEEKAETFRLILGIGFGLALLAGLLFGNRPWGMRVAGLTVAVGLLGVWSATVTGHSGGQLVYRHGAANYYVEGAGGPRAIRAAPGDSVPADEGAEHDDGHDH